MYRADKEIDQVKAEAICPKCGHRHPFNYLPMMFVCGPSCAGKSTVCQSLMGTYGKAVLLDGDILWRNEFASEESGGAKGFFDTWLRVAKNVGMSGKPVVLFNAGAIPDNVLGNVEARYFSGIHFLAMVCEDDELERRLTARPKWRGTHDPAFIKEQKRFNNWLKDHAQADGRNITLLDTSHLSEAEAIEQTVAWLDGCVEK